MNNPTPGQKTSPMKASGFAGLFGLFAGLCAIFAGAVTLSDWYDEARQSRWPVVSAIIEHANISVTRRAVRDGGGELWSLRLRLRFEANGETNTAIVGSPSVYSEAAAADMRSWAARHKGGRLDIRYDPLQPSRAILVSEVPGFVSNRTHTDLILFAIAATLSAALLSLAKLLRAREAQVAPADDDPRRAHPWMGLLFAAPGSVIGASAIYRATHDASLASDSWAALAIGLMFAFAGLLLALPSRYEKLRALLVALVVSLLAVSFDWVAFGPGERAFTASIAGLGFMPGEMTGRALFGIFAVIADICAIAIWINLWRGRFSGIAPLDSTRSSTDRSRPTPDRSLAV